jgi:hypothetical protein
MSYRYARQYVPLAASVLHHTVCVPIPVSLPIGLDILAPLLPEVGSEVLYCKDDFEEGILDSATLIIFQRNPSRSILHKKLLYLRKSPINGSVSGIVVDKLFHHNALRA